MSVAGAKVAARKIRVILADDHPVVRDGLAAIVNQQADMQVVAEAGDGAEALALYEEYKPDVMVLDLRMPKMDGAALYWALQLRHGAAMPRMIYVTGQAHSLDYAGFLAASRVPVLSKPFSPDDLRQAVRQALAGNG
jgi:DNA-binding NarL/FixJ family response regulator